MWKIEVKLRAHADAWIAVRLLDGPTAEEQAQKEFQHLSEWMARGRGPDEARLLVDAQLLASAERNVPVPAQTGRFTRDPWWNTRPDTRER